jgi:hypothetical protein
VSEHVCRALSDPQFQADALALRVELSEAVEDGFDPVLRNADPGIVDLDPYVGTASPVLASTPPRSVYLTAVPIRLRRRVAIASAQLGAAPVLNVAPLHAFELAAEV